MEYRYRLIYFNLNRQVFWKYEILSKNVLNKSCIERDHRHHCRFFLIPTFIGNTTFIWKYLPVKIKWIITSVYLRGRIKGTFSSVIQCTIFRVSMHWVTWGFCVHMLNRFVQHMYSVSSRLQVNPQESIRTRRISREVQVCSADFVIATHSTRKYDSWTHSTQYRRNYSKCATYNSNIQ